MVDGLLLNEEVSFTTFDILVHNSNYSPEYLKKIYIIEFYRIMRKTHQRIKNKKR